MQKLGGTEDDRENSISLPMTCAHFRLRIFQSNKVEKNQFDRIIKYADKTLFFPEKLAVPYFLTIRGKQRQIISTAEKMNGKSKLVEVELKTKHGSIKNSDTYKNGGHMAR